MKPLSRSKRLRLYETLYRIRASEEAIREHYHEDEMKTPMHMSLGEEAIVAGAIHALGRESRVFGSYRSHALYLAKTEETERFFAELYGKNTGVARGKAGSMHMSSPEHGFFGASAVVASPIPLALGVAFAESRKAHPAMTAVFFGDGAVDEGVFWESINIGSLWALPVLFVCEDNSLAIHVSTKARHSYRDITSVVREFGWNTFSSDSTDAEKIHDLVKRAIRAYEKTKKPSFLHLRYYRYLEHVGVNEDFDAGYRSRKEFVRWLRRDPIALFRRKLLRAGIRDRDICALEERIRADIARSIKRARQAPFPATRELLQNVYA